MNRISLQRVIATGLKRIALIAIVYGFFLLSFAGNASAVTADEPIAGIATVQAGQLEEALASINPGHIHPGIASLYIKWGNRFGIKADLAFAQMLHETNYLRYTGDVRSWQNNFAGIGATGGGNPGNSFPSAEAGVIAHYAHLAWYIFPNHVNDYCNSFWDPRHFGTGHNNTARTLRELGGKWAVPGLTYGEAIAGIASGIWDYTDSSYYPPLIGYLDSVYVGGPGRIDLSGWAIDPNTVDPIKVHVYVNGRWGGEFTAESDRLDIGSTYLRYGPNHGFSMSINGLKPGPNWICAYGINDGPGGNALLGCRTVDIPVHPFGNLDGITLRGPGQIGVDGWAIDPDTADPIDVHAYVDGALRGTTAADRDRPDLDAIYPGFAPGHGYSLEIDGVGPGAHSVCAYGINVQGGGNALLGCRTVYVPIHPFGFLDRATFSGPRGLDLSGWAIDPDTADPIDVHAYVDGALRGTTAADRDRPDLDAIYPGFAPGHGYSLEIDGVGPGAHSVCAYGINVQGGGNALLGCRTVYVPIHPFGSLDNAAVQEVHGADSGVVIVSGWAVDPDIAGPIDVHFYVNGQFMGVSTADRDRYDVAAVYPGFGPGHGFEMGITAATPGSNSVCAYGINTGPGGNVLLGCRVAFIAAGP